MTDLEGGEAAAVETTPAPAPEAGFSSQEQENKAPERDYEAEAREMGWVPEDEWKGDKKPAKFLSAEEFVERGETLIPILNKRLKDQEKAFAERLERIEKVGKQTVENIKKQHAKELAELRAQKRAAVQAGDVEAVEKLDEAIEDLKADAPDKERKLTGKALEEHNLKVQQDWVASQDWWGTDKKMTRYAIGYSQDLAAENPDITIEDNIRQTMEELKREFPEKFGGTKKASANGHALVDGGGDFSGAPKAKNDLFSRLPPEARAQAKQDVSEGIYPNVQAWAEVYFS